MTDDTNDNNELTVLLLNRHALCLVRHANEPWRHEPIYGEKDWHPLDDRRLAHVLNELDGRMNLTAQLAGFRLHLLYGQEDFSLLDNVAKDMAHVRCTHWQVLQWEPLQHRAAVLAGAPPDAPDGQPTSDWLLRHLLPVLQATFDDLPDPLTSEIATLRAQLATEHERSEGEHTERLRLETELASLRGKFLAVANEYTRQQHERLRLETEIASLRSQFLAVVNEYTRQQEDIKEAERERKRAEQQEDFKEILEENAKLAAEAEQLKPMVAGLRDFFK